jgi:uncharacterized protein with LGFP repeats
VEIDPPDADKTFTLIALNATGQTKQQVTVRVSSAGCTLTAAADMYEGPSNKYKVIDSLSAGLEVQPVGRNTTGEWLRVQASKEGWVNAASIKCKLAMLDFPTVSPADIPAEPTSTPTATLKPTNTPTPTKTRTPTPTATLPPPPPPILSEIDKKYAALGGTAGSLRNPSGPESVAPDGVGHYRHFEGGSIYWSPSTGAYVVQGLIRDKWAALGWEQSLLGYPMSDELTTPDGHGRYNHFQGGSIYWSPETGAFEVHGLIRDKWAALGWEQSFLGYPTTDESVTPDTRGRYNHFQNGSIYWTPQTGAFEINGAIHDKWASLGWENSPLGYPISDEEPSSGGWTRQSRFEHGIIKWSSDQGAVVFMNP